jgi:protein SCO1/2
MTHRRLWTFALTALLAAAFVQPAAAQVLSPSKVRPIDGQAEQALPNRLQGEVGIVEELGATVPGSLTFRDEAGREVQLESLLGRDRPVVVAFVYHSCPMLCSLVLDGVATAVAESDLAVGEDYDVLAVSIDPADTPARADSAKAEYVRRIGQPGAAEGLHFWTVTPETEGNVEALAEAVGFRYGYDVRTGEYAHGAALILLSPEGVVTRYLYGIVPHARDFRLALVEAGEGTIGNTLDRFLLTCFEYDEDAQSYSLAVLTVTKIGGGLLLLALGAMLFVFWRREARRTASRWDGVGSVPPAPAR